MEWLRFYTSTIDNPKIQRLPGPLYKVWGNFLCLNKIYGGELPPIQTIAFRLRVSEKTAQIWRDELVTRELIDSSPDGAFRMHDWDEHQYISDCSTPRVRKLRRKRHGNGEGNVSETVQNRPDTDTEQKQNRTEDGDMVIRSTPAWKSDPEFVEFQQDYMSTGGAFIDEDFTDAYWTWRILDAEQRLDRRKALIEKIERGAWSEPRFVPKPKKFIDTEWKRPTPKAPARSSRPDPVEMARKHREALVKDGIIR